MCLVWLKKEPPSHSRYDFHWLKPFTTAYAMTNFGESSNFVTFNAFFFGRNMAPGRKYQSLKEFYPFYLTEHQDTTFRVLHFIGTGLVFLIFFWAIFTQTWWRLILIPFVGYGFAWVGHYFFEKNKPATFQYPGYSLASDFILFFAILRGKQSLNPGKKP